jgi:hypothetical protein
MSRQTKDPSLAQDLLMLGDIYLTLGWIAIKRLRYGPLWPWDSRPEAPVVTLLRPQEEAEEETAETTAPRHG